MTGTPLAQRLKALGPGVLLAGIAIGTSHLVQSTRAGAGYGFSLIFIIVAACIVKYPAFRFGASYAAITRESLLQGYRKQGRWAVGLYIIIAIGTMFAAVPAVTLFTAGLAQAVFGITASTLTVCGGILIASVLLLALGGYGLLDRAIKFVMVLMAICTIVATIMVIPKIDWQISGSLVPPQLNRTNMLFVAALVGLMPTSIDISVWHSLWSVAKAKHTGYHPRLADTLWDFHIGYGGTLFLALCFVTLGVGTMHGKGIDFVPSASGFAEQLIQLYVVSLGDWSRPVIGASAFCVMLSTVLTGIDGYPRVTVELLRMRRGRQEHRDTVANAAIDRRSYILALIALAGGSYVILYFFLTSLKVFIDVAATIAFIFGPCVAWLNHRAMTDKDIPIELRPGRGLQIVSVLGIAFLTASALYYLFVQFFE